MALRIRHIATRLILLLVGAAVLPLLAFGVVSLLSLERGTRSSVVTGNLNVATRAAAEIQRYVAGHADILAALATDLQDTDLDVAQQDRLVKGRVLQFREYREITLLDQGGAPVVTSRVGAPQVAVPENPAATINNVAMSAIRLDAEGLPTAVFAVPLRRLNQPAGWLVGELNLEEMWRMVDQIRIGQHGFALVAGPDGTLIAHGNPDRKALIAQARSMATHPLVGAGDGAATTLEYVGDDGDPQLGVAAAIAPLRWTVIVEQPTAEAYASAAALQRQLVVSIAAALLVMIGLGLWFGRQFIAPIFLLQRATHSVAEGNLQTRVTIETGDEFADLGGSFNRMADRLVQLQEDVKRQERQAMFGRIAAGLVHDLNTPIQNIGNSATLLMRDDMDTESRVGFQRTIVRELTTLRRFLEDLRNVAKPKPIERFPVDVSASLAEIVEAMRPEADRVGVMLEGRYETTVIVEGDRFALERVYRNLISNALQATSAGGHVSVATRRDDGHVEIVVRDTGSGIAADRLPRIFDDFVTTKRRGLGLGLAITKRIVEQLDGTIAVESELGRGTAFTLRFPSHDDVTAAAAS